MPESPQQKNSPGAIARPFQELHSEELHEIIRRPPTWPVRWGVTLFFVLMLLLLAGSWLIRYPDTVAAPVTLASGLAPATVSVPPAAILTDLLVQDGDLIVKGQMLAYTKTQSTKDNTTKPPKRTPVTAPVPGRVLLAAPWQDLRQAAPGQKLLTIVPANGTVQGIIKLPHSSLGKIAVGQKVLVRLDAFPHREFGSIEAILSHISTSPGQDDLYWGYIDFPKKLKTSQGQELPYRIGMRGQAEIITKEMRLAERLFLKVSGSKFK